MTVDRLDVALIRLFFEEPRLGVLEASRRLKVARGTVQARLDRLSKTGIIRDFSPTIDPEALGYSVTAFVTAEVAQGMRNDLTISTLAAIPEVLEAHTITGQGDILIRIVASSNKDLQRLLDVIALDPNILRTSTVIALDTQIHYRTLPLVSGSAREE
ncbi:MAG: transcriptional regulator, AsnC family [Subtercola sp.]|nr:transcriptional regulator, AsnC family [Subtercola sp.]